MLHSELTTAGAPTARNAFDTPMNSYCNRAVSRAANYSALSGRSLPSRDTLAAIVIAWAPDGFAEVPVWNKERSRCERDLALRLRRMSEAPTPLQHRKNPLVRAAIRPNKELPLQD